MSIPAFHDTAAQGGDVKFFPLSLAQEGFWILNQFKPDRTLNTLSTTVHIRRALSTQALTRSLNALVQRHAALRTTDRKSTRLNSSHLVISYAVFCLKKKKKKKMTYSAT